MSRMASHIKRVHGIAVNVTDLDAAIRFYEGMGPLRVKERGRLAFERSSGLELETGGRVEWCRLDDGSHGEPSAVTLWRWERPGTTGEPYSSISSRGLVKFAFCYPLPTELMTRLAALGVHPTNAQIVRNYVTVVDPDQTVISYFHNPSIVAAALFHVHVSTSDLDRSLAFYRDVLGLEYWLSSAPDSPQPASQGPGGDLVQWNSHMLRHPSDRRFNIDIGQYVVPEPQGQPHRSPNEVGISSIEFEVDSASAAHTALVSALDGADWARARALGEVETWALNGKAVRVFHALDPDGNRLRFIERELVFSKS